MRLPGDVPREALVKSCLDDGDSLLRQSGRSKDLPHTKTLIVYGSQSQEIIFSVKNQLQ